MRGKVWYDEKKDQKVSALKLTREAPAKVNLTLDILGRRPAGYHDMRMVMQTVSLCDTVSVAETERGFCLKGMDGLIPEGKKTLEQRAAEAFFEAVGRPMPGLEVTLEKRTPAYAGLGGGSADVAALLRLLREAYAPELSTEELECIGFQVGSDMPFCVRGGTALAEGRGEILTDLVSMPDCHFVLCKPSFGIPTPELFALVDGGERMKRPDHEGMIRALEDGDPEGIAARLCNVFEEVLPTQYHEVYAIKARMLELGAMGAAMSGSGPTVFGIFPDGERAQHAAGVLSACYPQTYRARPVGKL